jgi:hypothetical protein
MKKRLRFFLILILVLSILLVCTILYIKMNTYYPQGPSKEAYEKAKLLSKEECGCWTEGLDGIGECLPPQSCI